MATRNSQSPASGSLSIDVRDIAGASIIQASVSAEKIGGAGRAKALRFEAATRLYVAKDLAPGRYLVEVRASGLESQSRVTIVQPAGTEEIFILGKKGLPSYYRAQVRVPFELDPALIAVTFRHGTKPDELKKLVAEMARKFQLRVEETPELARRSRMQLFRMAKADEGLRRELLVALGKLREIEHAGIVVARGRDGFTQLTAEAVVKFESQVDLRQAHEIARQHAFEVVREIPYIGNGFHLRSSFVASVELLAALEKLAERGDVVWAEPNLAKSPEVDSVVPTDVLWGGCWDRQLIGCSDAWQHLQDAGLETFGDPDLLIAVLDSGTQTSGGVPTSADFAGNVSNGLPKVFQAFDLDNMVSNNDAPWDPHGSGVAGVVSGQAQNPAPLPGQTAGLAGAAPNCRLILVEARTPFVDTEVADMLVWVAGFDPNSPLPGFPAPLTQGAGITTSSLGLGSGTLNGAGREAVDFLATFGRGGKGCLCFFSTGNNNLDNSAARPYSAHEKSFGIAASSFADDGASEIRAPYSGHGKIAFCAPSHDAYPILHNPNGRFATWGAHHQGEGNLISYRAIETSLAAGSGVGATSVTVASVAGLAVGHILHIGAIGALGSEPARITVVNAMTQTLTVQGWNGAWGGGLLNPHGIGTPVAQGPANHRNDFGGTSSATPLTAGAAALVLSANPDLTWVEARQVLRDTAVKFDLANTHPVGQWLDAGGVPSVMSGNPPVKSGWYGYGRIDVAAAVQQALLPAGRADLVVRDSLADGGAVPSAGAFWNSPDVWVRNADPAVEGAAGQPADYLTAGPHQSPIAGQSNWVYARVKNVGSVASLDAYLRISISHYPGFEFTYPASFIPTNNPGDPIPSPMTPGTYLIGEVKVTGIAPGDDEVVVVEWTSDKIPPQDVMVGMTSVHWHPCLLVECSPIDGSSTGNHVWDSNSLAQKNISIVYSDSSSGFAAAIVAGNVDNASPCLFLEVDRGNLPSSVRLYVDLIDPALKRRLRSGRIPRPQAACCCSGTAGKAGHANAIESTVKDYELGHHEGREVAFLRPRKRVKLPLPANPGALFPLVVGGIFGPGYKPGEHEIVLVQRDCDGKASGSAGIAVRRRQG